MATRQIRTGRLESQRPCRKAVLIQSGFCMCLLHLARQVDAYGHSPRFQAENGAPLKSRVHHRHIIIVSDDLSIFNIGGPQPSFSEKPLTDG